MSESLADDFYATLSNIQTKKSSEDKNKPPEKRHNKDVVSAYTIPQKRSNSRPRKVEGAAGYDRQKPDQFQRKEKSTIPKHGSQQGKKAENMRPDENRNSRGQDLPKKNENTLASTHIDKPHPDRDRRRNYSQTESKSDEGWERVKHTKNKKKHNQQYGVGSMRPAQTVEEMSRQSRPVGGEGNHSFYPEVSSQIRNRQQESDAEGKQQQGGERRFYLGYKQLENLAEQEACDIVVVLANSRSGFESLLKQQLRPDLLVLIVKVLSKLCRAEFEETKVGILSYACRSDFLDQLSKHIALLPLESNKKRKENIGSFLEDTLTFMEAGMNLLPSVAAESFEKVFMIMTMMKIFDGNVAISEDLTVKYKQLQKQHETCIEEQQKKKEHEKASNVTSLPMPDDDFRDISLFPTPEDILAEGPEFIRPNIVDAAYDSVDDYLDIQFRLLREDFVSPLREGISDYINMSDKVKKIKINNVRIYRKVYFVNPKIIKDRLGLVVCFDPDKKFKKVVWEHSKRFMFGSLLLFSRDNFTNVIFATVMDRDLKELKNGKIVVQLSENMEVSQELFNDEYVMAESQVYFEPYYHVLRALQHMPTDKFPMEKYIIRAETSDASPKYMTAEGGVVLDIDGRSVSVLKDSSWPEARELKLDMSQYNAFKSALTKEFVVVQGPPGTGKTFLGLKVAHVLLKNAPVWNLSGKPLLVVCYTNHALDQFLEGLIGVTNKIVRIGGQSKSKVLEEFNLKERRRATKKKRALFDLVRDIRYRMSDVMRVIQCIQRDLEMISGHRGIISLSVLQRVGILDQHVACFDSHDPRITNKLFTDWLEYGMYDDNQPPQAEAEQNQGGNEDQNAPQEADVQDDVDLDEEQRHMLDDLLDLNLEVDTAQSNLSFALDLNALDEEVKWHELQLEYIQTQVQQDPQLENRMQNMQYLCEDLRLRINYVQRQLSRDDVYDRRMIERLLQTANLWNLSARDRWVLYHYWIDRLRNALLGELRRHETRFRMEARMFEEAQQMNDLEVLKDSLVVGMTTTGAARLQTLLQALKAKIVIVEEAAEVMESHIVVSLTSHCEHLILIGDHQQLRPSPAVFRLARDYNFDISLFERMLKNNMHCEVLKVQHRMRPEIAKLIVPSIYAELENHASVMQFEKIRGMLKSLFFITHNHSEEKVDDTSSHRNPHEADFLIALCRYLVLQGYAPERITILATYSGQMFYLRHARKKHAMLNEVKITVVDNFQGEENDIILLSLVRSNQEAKIGFLKIENRVCVALSRAKMGFFIIGNMDNLTRSSKIWPKIRETLKQQDAIGPHLTLRCEVHPTKFTSVATAEDFNQVPEGGCSQLCGALLVCGHDCKSVCHIRNRQHVDYRCFEPCNRIPNRCVLRHMCRKSCWEDCGDCRTLVYRKLPCEHSMNLYCFVDPETYKCPVEIETELPACGHKVMKPCHAKVETFRCTHPCEERLPCGHSCMLRCHTHDDPDHLEYQCNKPCTRNNAGCKENHKCMKQCYEECGDCQVPVIRNLPYCEHTGRMKCSQDLETYLCKKSCTKTLPCGHPCPNVCSAKCGNCQVRVVKRVSKCGHMMEVKCCEDPDPELCKSPCNRLLSCGHKCTTVCCAPCITKCLHPIHSPIRPVCGHSVFIPCHWRHNALSPDSDELLSRCEMPCGALLSCEHRCAGTCGECLQGRIHKSCKEKCGKTLICGHSCNVPCAESCPPCNRKCTYRCKHSRCSRQCGQPCIPCKEPCDWACSHRRCKKLCHELCDREPCNEPCSKLLPCQHPCIGFCGEPCPPLCRICNADEVTAVFFGTEDEPDARFICLEDCKHVLEATGLEQWMSQNDNEIKLKECPVCKTPIAKTQRYMNIVKKVYQDVSKVKKRCFGNLREIEASRDELKERMNLLKEYKPFMTESSEFSVLCNKLWDQLQPIRWKKLNVLSAIDTGTLRIQVEIFSQIVDCYAKSRESLHQEARATVVAYMDKLLRTVRKREKKISAQEIDDMKLEIQRFYRLCQLYKIVSEPPYRNSQHNPKVKKSYEDARNIAYSIEKFTKARDQALKMALEGFARLLASTVKITDAEKREIVSAMGYKQGHWYKCPNGHIYIITECGGAMQTSKCPECGAAIGGSGHRLLSSNRVATEMDGATRPAWPQ
ncbi:NFX1-type zinc finger-containing protein 1-like [Periplaneta americana]|uniref:NFX1-type zinc finger-containing protein 1-like n=1 Tax=Periplaneta americana TaxID=6978 RepID=UPI0037E7915B